MLKENKGKLIITSIITLLPILIGLILWNQLPDKVPTHWNAEGVVDGWSSKAFAVFGLPLFLFVVHWVCLLASSADPKRYNYADKILSIVFWICPVISVLGFVLIYATALGMELKVDKIMLILVGVTFAVIGNYLPKCKQNYTMGIKIPWTLNDEENWNYTHRLGGKVWVATGVIIMFCLFLPAKVMFVTMLVALFAAIMVPVICSYLFYKKKEKNAE